MPEVAEELASERHLITKLICNAMDDWLQCPAGATRRRSVQNNNRPGALMVELPERYLANMLVLVYVYILSLQLLLLLGGLQWGCLWFLPCDNQNKYFYGSES